MASPATRSRQSGARQSFDVSGIGAHKPYDHGHPPFSPDVYSRQASSYSARSSQVSRSGSIRAAAQRVAGVFGSCFVPRIQVKTQEDKDESSVADYHVSVDSEQPIIHGAIRSSGVLLTDALTAKVAGFGLAGMAASGSGSGSEATPVKGAAGYVDPEYLRTYQLTDKSDVYSFGVLLVELVTGRPPVERSRGGEPRLTTKWALQKRRGGEAVVAMDPRMRRSPASVATAERMMALAEQCVAPARKDRPSMRRCSELLWAIRRDYHRREQPRADAIAEERDDEWVIR